MPKKKLTTHTTPIASPSTSAFTRTSLKSLATVGERLSAARNAKGLTIETCAAACSIQAKYLVALEEGHYSILPGSLYARTWTKKYATFLDVNDSQLTQSFEREWKLAPTLNGGRGHEEQSSRPILSSVTRKLTLRGIGTLIILMGLISYLGWIIYQGIRPPVVTFDPQLTDFRTQDSSTQLKGRTSLGVMLSINGALVNLDDTGAFVQEVTLRDGTNTVTIRANRKHSLTFMKDIRIIKTAAPSLIATTTATTTGL